MLPYFYHPSLNGQQQVFTLDEPTSKHCIQVLRMQEGEDLLLTNGKGLKVRAKIVAADRKRCGVQVEEREQVMARPHAFALGIAFTKNKSRNEWLLEKVTEMGIEAIFPLVTARSEKEKFNEERYNSILVAAMLQSQQCYLPVLQEPLVLKKISDISAGYPNKLIAHCLDTEPRTAMAAVLSTASSTLVLIGPEGDFTQDEVTLCLDNGFRPVSLGANRLRTETAGLYACTLFNALTYA